MHLTLKRHLKREDFFEKRRYNMKKVYRSAGSSILWNLCRNSTYKSWSAKYIWLHLRNTEQSTLYFIACSSRSAIWVKIKRKVKKLVELSVFENLRRILPSAGIFVSYCNLKSWKHGTFKIPLIILFSKYSLRILVFLQSGNFE